MMVLLRVLTFDSWTPPMYGLFSSFPRWVVTLYYGLVVVFGGFFVVNLFLAVILKEFHTAVLTDKLEVEGVRSKAQLHNRGWQTSQKIILTKPSDDDETRGLLVDILQSDGGMMGSRRASARRSGRRSKAARRCGTTPTRSTRQFGNCMALLVVANVVVMCLPYQGMSEEYAHALERVMEAITWVFIGEMLFKLLVLGWAPYWRDRWNALDGFVARSRCARWPSSTTRKCRRRWVLLPARAAHPACCGSCG